MNNAHNSAVRSVCLCGCSLVELTAVKAARCYVCAYCRTPLYGLPIPIYTQNTTWCERYDVLKSTGVFA